MGGVSDWRALLTDWSKELLTDEEVIEALPGDVIKSGWLGYDPVTEKQILLAEQRLATRLPHSYRTFLQTTNGWCMTGRFVYRVRPDREIDWYRDEHRMPIRKI